MHTNIPTIISLVRSLIIFIYLCTKKPIIAERNYLCYYKNFHWNFQSLSLFIVKLDFYFQTQMNACVCALKK